MLRSSQVPTRIAVQVDLQRPLDELTVGARGQDVRDRLQAHAEDLVNDLGIPATVALTLTSAPRTDAIPGPAYRVVVNGRSCRLPLCSSDPVAESPSALARAIGWEMCRNRTLFLTLAITEQLRTEWSREAADQTNMMPVEMLHALLSELIARGVRLDAARPIATIRDEAPDAVRLRRLLEDQLSTSSNAPRIAVALSGGHHQRLCSAGASRGDNGSLDELLEDMPDTLFGELGLLVPPPAVTRDHRLDDAEFRVQLNDLRWPPVEGLRQDEWLVDTSVEDLRRLGVDAAVAAHPLTGASCARVHGDGDLLEKCRDQGRTLGPAGFITATALAMARQNAASLLTSAAVSCLVDRLHDAEPALVDAAERRFDPPVLTWIMREFLEEQISIRNVRNLLESLLSVEGAKSSAVALGERISARDITFWVDWIRPDFHRQIMYHHTGTSGSLAVYLIAPELEARIAAVDIERLSEDDRYELIQPVCARQRQEARPLQILTSLEVKRILRHLIAHELPEVAVLAYQELDPTTNITPRGRIGDTTDGASEREG